MKIKTLLLVAAAAGIAVPASVYADDYVDDIYFNPKKDNFVGAKKKNPNYIENFSDMDVDAYNLRGQYYTTPIDTIGAKISSEEDFVYTQQIQKYYNPTIVLDNSQLLADVLENSYGNVEIVFNGLTPAFLPTYGYGWPYYSGYYNPWSWNIGGWGWSVGGWYDPWYWGPSWSWGWGPSWSCGPSWSWGWGGPGWGPGPSWGWGGPNGTWSPGGNRPVSPGLGWAGNQRHPSGSGRPSSTARPGSSRPSSGSQWSIVGNQRTSNRNSGISGNRQNASSVGNNRGYTIGNDGHRYRGTGSVNSGSSNSNRNNGNYGNNRNSGTTRGSSYNSNTNSNRNSNYNSIRNSGSYNSGRSSGNGSFGGGSFGGGRSSGGGGGRGGRR